VDDLDWTTSRTEQVCPAERQLDQSSHFCTAGPCVQHADTETTLRATRVEIGRINAVRAGDTFQRQDNGAWAGSAPGGRHPYTMSP